MITQSMQEDSPLSVYVHYLLQLHEKMAAGADDSDEAEAIRDAMDEPWYQMGDSEVEFADGLSADLYTIGVSRADPDPPSEEALNAIVDAEKKRQWDVALQRIRQHEKELPAHYVAAMRALCLGHLHLHIAAIPFAAEAVRLRPDDAAYVALLMTLYLQTAQTYKALELARELVANDAPPAMRLIAAESVFICAELLPDDFQNLSAEAIAIAQPALQLTEKSPSDEYLQHKRATTLLLMSMALDRLGEHEKAMDACSAAIEAEPNNPDAMLMHLLLTSTPTEPRAKDTVRSALVRNYFEHLQQDTLPSVTN